MPYGDDDIIRNGTFSQWLTYRVKFGKKSVFGFVVVLAAVLAGVFLGAWIS